jgi:hypothetical protein
MDIQNIESLIIEIENQKSLQDYSGARETVLEGLKVHTDDYRLYEELADIYLF